MASLTQRNNRLLAEKELVDILTLHKIKNIEILGHSPDSNTQLENFYRMLSNREVNNDEEAAAKLLGSKPTDNDYLKLKANFRRRATNTLFFIDLKEPEFSELYKAHKNIWKYVASMRICKAQGARHAAIDIALKGIKQAIRYEMSAAIVEFAKLLIEYSSIHTGNETELDKYAEIANHYQEVCQAELKAKICFAKLIQPYVNKREYKKETNPLAQKYLKEIRPLVEKYPYFILQGAYYQIAIAEKFSKFDYLGVKEVTEAVIKNFSEKKFEARQTIGSLNQVLIGVNTILKNFDLAEIAAQNSLKAVVNGSPLWFNTNRLYIIALLNASRYTEAYQLYQKSMQHKKFESLADAMKELWWLMEGYFYLLIRAGEIAAEELGKRPKNFSQSAYLNRFSIFSKDKRGINVCVQITHSLFHLFDKEYIQYEDKLNTLAKYKRRHLSNQEDGYRTTCFIESLQIIQQENFEIQPAVAETIDLRNRMSEVPQMLVNQPEEVEILAYEKLWNIAEMAMLN